MHRFVEHLQITKEPIVVTLRGEPIARLEPIAQPKKRVHLGALKGRMIIKDDIIKSDFEKDWLVQ
jgi:antitoxin (DNA-binding transcriptional repressor) of toxin-antitoxin stability system